MALGGKMGLYAAARAEGLKPQDAGIQAGYATVGLRVAVSRIEAREDVQAEIRRLKRGGKRVDEGKDDDKPEGELAKWAMRDRYANPLELMLDVMNNPKAPTGIRYQAAKDALPYCHARVEGGKREQQKDEAKKAGKGKFQTTGKPSNLGASKH